MKRLVFVLLLAGMVLMLAAATTPYECVDFLTRTYRTTDTIVMRVSYRCQNGQSDYTFYIAKEVELPQRFYENRSK
jgi:hypothetical protein